MSEPIDRTHTRDHVHSRAIAMVAAAILFVVTAVGVGAAEAASTNPVVRNVNPEVTQNPPEAGQPIYYPLGADLTGIAVGVPRETLLFQFMERHTASDYPAAAEAALRLVAAAPERPEAHYNLACVLTRMNRLDEAAAALAAAIDAGWRDVTHTRIDPDLARLRGSERFEQLIAKIKSMRESERIMPGPLRADPWQTVAADVTEAAPRLLARYHVPGASVALVRDGEVVWAGAFGVRDARSTAALETDDPFRVTAPLHLLVVLAGLELDAEERLGLLELLRASAEAQVAARGPEVRVIGAPPAPPAGVPAGRSRGEDDRRVAPARRGEARASDAAAAISCRPPSYARNSMYGRLRNAVELGAGAPFPEYCQNVIFPKAGLERARLTSVPDDEREPPEEAVLGHSFLGSPMRPTPAQGRAAFDTGVAVRATATNLARLIAAVLTDQPSPARPHLSASSAIDFAAQIDRLVPGGLGLSFSVQETAAGSRVQALDSAAGIVCLMRWYPETKSGVVVLCNSADGLAVAERLAHLALGGE